MVHSFYLLCLERCVLFRMSLFGSLFRLSERHMKTAVGFEYVFNGLINLPASPVSVRWIDFFRCPVLLSSLGQTANQIGDVKRWYGGKLFHKLIDIGHPLLLVCCASHRKFRRNSVLARITDLIALFRSALMTARCVSPICAAQHVSRSSRKRQITSEDRKAKSRHVVISSSIHARRLLFPALHGLQRLSPVPVCARSYSFCGR